MKKTITTLALIGMMTAAHAQCDNHLTYTTDEFTGKGSWTNKQDFLISPDGKNGMGTYLIMSDNKDKTLIWVIASTEVGCVDEGAKVELVFTDQTRMTLYGNGKFNCQGKATVYFGSVFGKKNEMTKIATTPIEMIRVHGSRSLHSEKFDTQMGIDFMNAFNCLVENRK